MFYLNSFESNSIGPSIQPQIIFKVAQSAKDDAPVGRWREFAAERFLQSTWTQKEKWSAFSALSNGIKWVDINIISTGLITLEVVVIGSNEPLGSRINANERDTCRCEDMIWWNFICVCLAGGGPHTLYFAVKFYAVDPCQLVEELTR